MPFSRSNLILHFLPRFKGYSYVPNRTFVTLKVLSLKLIKFHLFQTLMANGMLEKGHEKTLNVEDIIFSLVRMCFREVAEGEKRVIFIN